MMRRRYFTKSLFLLPIALQFVHSKFAEAASTRKGFMLGTAGRSSEAIKADAQHLIGLSATLIRLPIYFSYEPQISVWLNTIDAVLSVCEPSNVVVVVDVHHPGSRQDSTIENEGDFINKWSQISQRFANRRLVWFDLCNEPNHPDWRNIALRTAQAIRQPGINNRIIYAAPGTTTRGASRFEPLPGITNQTLQFHFYDWVNVQCPTGQCSELAPYPSPNRTREDLRNQLIKVADVGKRHKMPVYIGEVALPHYHPNAPRFLRDFTSICDELGIHLSVHAFREADIWNYEKNPKVWKVLTDWLRR
ncbi:MAG: glycoside hydrolase family 5 protein [Phormidesmis sp. CAN_BIN44]|nr:glycoside hydrolase family 5 protein [Phormidesmis sp. CAN_BIN44]